MGGWNAATKMKERRGAKNAALIPSVRTPHDSKLGLITVGDRPSLELYRGSSLLGSRLQWLKKCINCLMKRGDYKIYLILKEIVSMAFDLSVFGWVFWICVYLLEMAYSVAMVIGATSSCIWSKFVTLFYAEYLLIPLVR
ncbi:hypothetical protein BHM03_00010261 [Ensete ventricosum]|uniref:Uncharacterized protein n=1 Tax=Ensete ventricosum TaxID=4639 RepID=A0A445MCV9_ENSVE|nr:hypothetical protein BHM03_00010261 [Ensete ventricosum]